MELISLRNNLCSVSRVNRKPIEPSEVETKTSTLLGILNNSIRPIAPIYTSRQELSIVFGWCTGIEPANSTSTG